MDEWATLLNVHLADGQPRVEIVKYVRHTGMPEWVFRCSARRAAGRYGDNLRHWVFYKTA